MLGRIAAIAALMLVCVGAAATPVQLGNAGTYTLLSTGSPWASGMTGGSLTLGSSAYIHGNVGARHLLSLGSGAVVDGDADYGLLLTGAGASILGTSTTRNDTFWLGLYQDLQTASDQAQNLTGTDLGNVTSSLDLHSSGALTVFNINDLYLQAGDTITVNGSANDQFVFNVSSDFMLGGGAAITLNGVSGNNVLFNIYGGTGQGSFNVAAGTMQGVYLAPNVSMILGDGLDLHDVRFLGRDIQGNLQTVYAPSTPRTPRTPVPEPSSLLMLFLGLLSIGVLVRANRQPNRQPNRGQSTVSPDRCLRGRPTFAGPALRPSCASMRCWNRLDPSA